MLSKYSSNTSQMQFVSIEQLVPNDHLLRKIEAAIDFSFIYDLVEEKYSSDFGRPSIDPVTLIKIPMIQYLFGIRSMRQTIKEIEVNVAYRWFLGLGFYDPVPHFSTFGKNYKRRFEDTDLFEQIFEKILAQCVEYELVDSSVIFVDSTHVKAAANNRKFENIEVIKEGVKFYEKSLIDEINQDRYNHERKSLKPNNKQINETKEIKVSTTDPDSGWFHKGEHKQVFAYSVETACDKHGWILGYTIHPGNIHDS